MNKKTAGLSPGLSACSGLRPSSGTYHPGADRAIVHSATGAGNFFTLDGHLRTFAFTVREHADGSVDGQAQVKNPLLGTLRHFQLDCLSVRGNLAIASGTVTSAEDPSLVGAPAISRSRTTVKAPARLQTRFQTASTSTSHSPATPLRRRSPSASWSRSTPGTSRFAERTTWRTRRARRARISRRPCENVESSSAAYAALAVVAVDVARHRSGRGQPSDVPDSADAPRARRRSPHCLRSAHRHRRPIRSPTRSLRAPVVATGTSSTPTAGGGQPPRPGGSTSARPRNPRPFRPPVAAARGACTAVCYGYPFDSYTVETDSSDYFYWDGTTAVFSRAVRLVLAQRRLQRVFDILRPIGGRTIGGLVQPRAE